LEKLTMSVNDAAEAIGVHPLTLRKAIERGEIQAVRVGKRVLIPVQVLEGFLKGLPPKVAR
jgi:excisionase family DNA binding protein